MTIDAETPLGHPERPEFKKTNVERSDFALRIQYKNSLPDLLYDTKSIPCSMSALEASSYKQTSLEREYNYELNFEDDVFSNVDLVNIDQYKPGKTNAILTSNDVLLLKDEDPLDKIQSASKKTDVSWLRKSDLIRATAHAQTHSSLLERTIVPDANLSSFKNKYRSKEEQIAAINKTFEDAKIPILKHYRNPNLKPVETHYVFPDENFWKHTLSLINFDARPSAPGMTEPLPREQICQSVLKGLSDENGEFVGYFCKDNNPIDEKIHDTRFYSLIREYNWVIKTAVHGSNEEQYIWRVDPNGGVYYNEISARVRMTKRRLPGQKIQNKCPNKVLILKNCEETAEDLNRQNKKLSKILPQELDSPKDGY